MELPVTVRYSIMNFINRIFENYGVLSSRSCDNFIENNDRFCPSVTGECITLDKGSSKVCLFFDSLPDKVIKIPLIHNVSKQQEKIMARDYYFSNKRTNYYVNQDLCALEVQNYHNAQRAGIDNFFAAEEFVMNYHGVPVYIQDKVKYNYIDSERYMEDWEDCEEPEELEVLKKIDKIVEEKRYGKIIDILLESIGFVIDLYNYSGEETFVSILDFLYYNDINDLHEENIGYGFNGNPMFFDYSGF